MLPLLRHYAPPTIITQPVDVSIYASQSATFSVVASGAPLTYQWSRNGTAIPSATAATYTVTTSDVSLDGSVYRVTVTNPSASVLSSSATLRVTARAPQVISGFNALDARAYGDQPFAITGVTGGASGNPVVFSSSNTSVASISGTTVIIQGGGTAVITANQAGSANFTPALPVAQTLVINRIAQTITFTELAPRIFGQLPSTLSAQASSGLTVAFSVVSGPATISGNQLSVTDVGTVTISAAQDGNNNYLPATAVERSMVVTSSLPIIATQPVGREIHLGESGILQVALTNPGFATYQWYRNGQLIDGATQSSYTVTVLEIGNADYRVVVSNRFGTVTSDIATVRGTYLPVSITSPPLSLTVNTGLSASWMVVAQGTPPLSYQWLRDGEPIAGATQAAYSSGTLTFADHGARFQVVVSNIVGPLTSQAAVLTVLAPPQILVQPQNTDAIAGLSASMTMQVVGSAPLSYQWFRNGVLIAGASSATLQLPLVLPEDDGSIITARVSNSQGNDLSLPATLHVSVLPPVITTQPAAVTIGVGESATLAVVVRSAVPVTYQWYRNGSAIDGATSSQVIVHGDSVSADEYRVVISNRIGDVPSDTVVVRVINRPVVITAQPQAQAIAIGQTAFFSVMAEGTTNITYQWLKNGVAISGATSRTFTTPILALVDDGALYQVDVANIVGVQRSNSAQARVYAAPVVAAPPVDVTLYEGSSAAFSVTITSVAPVSYQWYRNGVVISGATTRIYNTAPVTNENEGDAYSVVATNLAGVATAGPAVVHINARLPQIITGFNALSSVALGTTNPVLTGVQGGASGNRVYFTSSNSAVAWMNGPTVMMVGVGTTQITAHQDGSALYAPAPSVTQSLTVTKGTQIITFGEPHSQPFGVQPFTLSAQASSGLPVVFSIQSGPATITDANLMSLTGTGSVVIAANQSGNANYESAPTVVRTLVVESTPPIITRQPRDVSAPVGDAITMSVEVSNAQSAQYQWYRNGVAISGASAATYVGVSPAVETSDIYRVEISNLVGTTVSANARVQGVILAPTIVTHPQNTAIFANQPATFSVVARGSAPLTYQWFRAGVLVPNATASTWTTSPVTTADEGVAVHVVVTNTAGSAISNMAYVRVNALPRLVRQPLDVIINAGQPVTFSVEVDSTLAVAYQWTRNGVSISGANAPSYRLSSTTMSDNGAVFQVAVTNQLGTTTSALATLQVVLAAPTITQQPINVVIASLSEEVAFTVVASSPIAQSYQWLRNGEMILFATSASLVFRPIADDIGAVYTVVVTNSAGSITSANAVISRIAKPVIIGQPAAVVAYEGQRATFQVYAVAFDPARVLSYQWKRNGIAIPGATETALTFPAVTLSQNNDQFSVVVSDGPEFRESNTVGLRVLQPVVINRPATVSNPSDTTVNPGESASFYVGVDGSSPLSIQWYRNGQPILGANETTYQTPPVLDADYGAQFHVIVSNAFGTATSTTAQILAQPVIESKATIPAPDYPGVTVTPLLGNPVSFSVTARGARPMSYRWFRNGIPIPDGASPSYTVPAVTLADDRAVWSVTVSNRAGEATAIMPTVLVFSQLPVIDQPQDQVAMLGRAVSFYVSAYTHPLAPLSFQWYRNGQPIAGETRSQLDLPGITEADVAAQFTVVVSNRFGSVTSRVVKVTVVLPIAIITQPTSAAVSVGEAATFTVVTNSPGLTYVWRKNGNTVSGYPYYSPTYTTELATADDHGAIFDVVISGPYGQTLVSTAVTLSVVDNPPVITTQPEDAYATVGQSAIFRVLATGNKPLHYQWYQNDTPIEGQDNDIVSIPILSLAGNGSRIHVVVSNARGTATSSAVTLTVGFVPAVVQSDPDLISEIHGDSAILSPRAVVSNGDKQNILYLWSQVSGETLPQVQSAWNPSSRLLLTGLKPGSYTLRCSAVYGISWYSRIDETEHIFKFNVTGILNWITPPKSVGSLTDALTMRLEALAGFSGKEDTSITYQWSQVSGPTGVIFSTNAMPAAKQTQIQFPERGKYTLACKAMWRNLTISRNLVIDTEVKTDGDGSALATLAGRTLLIGAVPFDATQWNSSASYRTSYLAGIEPSRVWQSAAAGGGKPTLNATMALRLQAAAGSTITLAAQSATGAPISFAALHGGQFTTNHLNIVTVAANGDGNAAVTFKVPQQSGTYVVCAASPLAVGRLSFTVVVP